MESVDRKKLADRLDEIARLSAMRDEIEKKLAILTGVVVEKDPTPKGFDYKEAILQVFNENPGEIFDIDDITQEVSTKHKFKADRATVANRMNYLTDRDQKLERVLGKRGFYTKRIDFDPDFEPDAEMKAHLREEYEQLSSIE